MRPSPARPQPLRSADADAADRRAIARRLGATLARLQREHREAEDRPIRIASNLYHGASWLLLAGGGLWALSHGKSASGEQWAALGIPLGAYVMFRGLGWWMRRRFKGRRVLYEWNGRGRDKPRAG